MKSRFFQKVKFKKWAWTHPLLLSIIYLIVVLVSHSKCLFFQKQLFKKNKHHTILKYNPTMPRFQYLINYKELIFLKNRKSKNQQFKHQKIPIFSISKNQKPDF